MTFKVTKMINGKEYTYLRYSYREGGKPKAIEMGITKREGTKAGEIEVKQAFIKKVVDQRWTSLCEAIKASHQHEMSKLGNITKQKALDDFGIRFTHDTNKIEGSTLSFRDVKSILVARVSPDNKPMRDVIEAKAHMALFKDMLRKRRDLTLDLVLPWHERLFSLSAPQIAGKIRDSGVLIKGSKYTPPYSRAEVERGLDGLFTWYERSKHVLHPVLLACLVKFRFVSIHPFADGNGRVSRIIMNYLLHSRGYPMFNITYAARRGYYRALEMANMKDDELHFVHWFFMAYTKAHASLLKG